MTEDTPGRPFIKDDDPSVPSLVSYLVFCCNFKTPVKGKEMFRKHRVKFHLHNAVIVTVSYTPFTLERERGGGGGDGEGGGGGGAYLR